MDLPSKELRNYSWGMEIHRLFASDMQTKALVKVSPSLGWALACLVLIPTLVHSVGRIIDPVATRRWESKYWHRFRADARLPEFLDPAALEQSRARRIQERLYGIITLGFLIMMAAVIMLGRGGSRP